MQIKASVIIIESLTISDKQLTLSVLEIPRAESGALAGETDH